VTVQAVSLNDIQDLITSVAEIHKDLPWQDRTKSQELLCGHQTVFAIQDGKRGEIAKIQMEIRH